MPPKKETQEYDPDALPEDILIGIIGKITPKDSRLKQIQELFETFPDMDVNSANVLQELANGDEVEVEGEEYDIIMDTVMSLTIKKNAPDVVEELIVRGADLSISIGGKEDTVMHLLVQTQNLSMLHVILNKVKEVARDEYNDDSEEWNEQQKHSDNADKDEEAIFEELKFLLAIKNKEGLTPVDMAVNIRNSSIAELLIENGAEYDFHSADEDGLLPIHRAVRNSDTKMFEFLLNIRQSPFTRDTSTHGRTVLHHAVLSDCMEIFDILSKKCGGKLDPSFVDTEDNGGATALVLAVESSKWEIVKLLSTKYGARIDQKSSRDGMNVLHRAAFHQRFPIVENLVNSFKLNVAESDRDGNTPLHWAASSGAVDIVRFLIDKKVEINAQNNKGHTPLRNACFVGSVEVVELLLAQKKIDVGIVGKNGRNILHEAAGQGHDILIDILLKHEETSFNELRKKGDTTTFKSSLLEQEDHCHHTPLELCIHAGQSKSAVVLIGLGANVERRYKGILKGNINDDEMHATDDEGFVTILQHAVCLQYEDIVQHILHKSSKHINTIDCRGRSPLHNAVLLNNFKLVNMLASYTGCDINMKELDRGYTPLMIACERSQVEICNFMVKNVGAALDIRDLRGMTALHISSQKFQIEIVRLLVESGSDITRVDLCHRTPLHAACEKNNVDVACYLIEKGAQLDVCDELGFTPLHTAVYNGAKECTELLIQNGAQMNTRDVNGRTPLILASEMGQTECGRSLVRLWSLRKDMQ